DLVLDLVQELNARGRSVLVVSQRRRNLAQLVAIAEQRGIEELVFDLSPDPSLQRNASASLLRSLRRAGTYGLGAAPHPPPPAAPSWMSWPRPARSWSGTWRPCIDSRAPGTPPPMTPSPRSRP